jgi:hypothetical protein
MSSGNATWANAASGISKYQAGADYTVNAQNCKCIVTATGPGVGFTWDPVTLTAAFTASGGVSIMSAVFSVATSGLGEITVTYTNQQITGAGNFDQYIYPSVRAVTTSSNNESNTAKIHSVNAGQVKVWSLPMNSFCRIRIDF